MVERFAGRTAIVTGGANGIGRATTRRLLAEGARVVVFDVQPAAGDAVRALFDGADTARLAYAHVDITDEEAVGSAVETAASEGLDVLVNNAGFGTGVSALEDVDLAEWNRLVGINLTGAFICTRAAVPHLKARGAGRIVNLSSMAGRSVAENSNLPYAAAKGGILAFTRRLAQELGPFGITVNAVAPGLVLTDRVRTRLEGQPRDVLEGIVSRIPLRRAGTPEDIAGAVAYLASDDAGFVTGACLDVNGGRAML